MGPIVWVLFPEGIELTGGFSERELEGVHQSRCSDAGDADCLYFLRNVWAFYQVSYVLTGLGSRLIGIDCTTKTITDRWSRKPTMAVRAGLTADSKSTALRLELLSQ